MVDHIFQEYQETWKGRLIMISKCPYCGEFFGANLLEMHIALCEKKHQVVGHSFICSICDKSFSEEKEYLKHKKIHHKEVVNDLFRQ